MKIQPVILAGGEGKRLAPLSSPKRPKPFIPLPDGQSLLEKTCRRLRHQLFLPPIVIGNAKDRYALTNHARAAQVMPTVILLEEEGLNTAFAVAYGAQYAAEKDSETMLLFLPADHIIENEEAWRMAVSKAATLATEQDALTLMGVAQKRFSPDLGYMRLEGTQVVQFIEKPTSETKLAASGQWMANSGQFIGTSRCFLRILADNSPEIASISKELMENRQNEWEYEKILTKIISFTPPSFDVAVLQKTKPLYAVAFEGGWQDLGTREAWEEYTRISIHNQMLAPDRTDRPWGYYELLESNPDEVTKRLHVFPGCRLSRQRHFYRSEHWTIESGTAYIEKGDEKTTLQIYESIKIPPATWHRLVNPTEDMLIIKEIQYGISDEMDIEREEDDYGRI